MDEFRDRWLLPPTALLTSPAIRMPPSKPCSVTWQMDQDPFPNNVSRA
jgi:hypothetical protein